jgi:hypothetical protein
MRRIGFFAGDQGTSLALDGPGQTGNINSGGLGSYVYNDDGFNYDAPVNDHQVVHIGSGGIQYAW